MSILRIREKLRQIVAVKEPPRRVAAAFALGIFIGMSPLLGIHTLLGIALAWQFRLNKLVTVMGVYVTNPWTIVPIYTVGTWFGAWLLGMHDIIPDIDWSHMTLLGFVRSFRPLLLPFLIGNTLMGTVAAALAYGIVYKAVKASRG
jgi:uncharacterized protein (DUF2062 family)